MGGRGKCSGLWPLGGGFHHEAAVFEFKDFFNLFLESMLFDS